MHYRQCNHSHHNQFISSISIQVPEDMKGGHFVINPQVKHFSLVHTYDASGEVGDLDFMSSCCGLWALDMPFIQRYAYYAGVLTISSPCTHFHLCLTFWDMLCFQVPIRPIENRLLSFRGDAHHRVESFASPAGKNRMSIVCEQYKIQPQDYHLVVTLDSTDWEIKQRMQSHLQKRMT